MPDELRIDELQRRLAKDPASIAFAQLGEELRRAGRHPEAVDICRAGLSRYPAYLSARVTLGRALTELHQLDEARRELQSVLAGAPDHLGAARALAELEHRCRVESLEVSPSHTPGAGDGALDQAGHSQAVRTLNALETWLAAIHVARAGRST